MDNLEFFDYAKEELARYVSKTGDFELAEDVLNQCIARLDSAQAVSLYKYIRDESRRLEEEWRDEFKEAFPDIADELPDPVL